MGMLRREWTKHEIQMLGADIKAAKVKVFNNWGFSNDEINKILDIPVSVIEAILKD